MNKDLQDRIYYADKYKREHGTEMVVVKHGEFYESWTENVFEKWGTKDYEVVYRTKDQEN